MAQKRRSSREALLVAAGEVFAARGYQRSTITDIADAAGISRPTLYNYAKSKASLLEQITLTVVAEMEESAEAVHAMDAPVDVRLRALLRGHVDLSIKHRVFYGILFSEENELPEDTKQKLRTWSRERTHDFRRLFKECADEGLVTAEVDLSVMANLVNSAMSTLYRWYHPAGRVRPADLARHAELLVAGFIRLP